MNKSIRPREPTIPNSKGFTFLELIFIVLVLAVAIVPMIRAFAPAVQSAGTEEEATVFANQARGTLYRVAALDFDTLNGNQGDPVDLATLFGSAAEADKETFTFKGQSYVPSVAITDASGGLGGLLQLTATMDYVRFTTLKTQF